MKERGDEVLEKEIIESIIGIDIKIITNKGEYKTIRMTDFNDVKDSWISINCDESARPLGVSNHYKMNIHIESKGYDTEVVEMDGWIPCSVRTPDIVDDNGYSENVLTIVEWWDGDIDYDVGWYSKKYGWSSMSKDCKVLAWQPLPPKYNPNKTRI